MLSFSCLFEVKLGPAGYYLYLEAQVLLQDLLEGHNLRHAVYQGEHNYADGVLKLSEAEQLVEDYLRISVLFELDDYAHSVSVRLIADSVDAVNSLVLDKLRYRLDELRLVDHIGYLGDDYGVPAVYLLYIGS